MIIKKYILVIVIFSILQDLKVMEMSVENGVTSADTDEVKIGVIQILPGFGLFIICGFILHTNRQ
jgi:hypothetical protein